MKSNFALSLSFDGLRLMHRVTGGWHLVGEVALDDPDMTGSLARLRAAAAQLEPSGLRTKLLIPNDQIRYLALDTTRTDDAAVRAALDGATPYAVDDLAYDFTIGGGRTYIAAVARETLEEARQFASEHGFNPTDYAAVPEPFTFVGEANFGGVDGKAVARDDEPLVVIGTTFLETMPEPTEAQVQADTDVAEDNVNTQAEAAPSVSDPAANEGEPDEGEPDTGPKPSPEDDGVAQPAAQTDTTPADDVTPDDATAQEPAAESTGEPEGDPAPVFASRLRADRSDGATAPAPPVNADKTDKADKADLPPRAEPSMTRPSPAPVLPTLAVPTEPGTDRKEPGPALFATSRDADQPTKTPPVVADVVEPETAPPVTGEAATALPETAAASAASLMADRNTPAPESSETATAKALGAASAVGGAVGGMFASRRMAKAEVADVPTEAEKTKTSVFGARKQPKPKSVVGGKPRFLGLILTAVLLLFLLALAAFAALSEDGLAGWFRSNDTVQTAAATPDAASEVAAPDTADAAGLAEAATAPSALIAPTGAEVLTPEEAERIYAATGVWQRAPRIPLTPRTTSLDGMIVDAASRPVTRVPASPLADAGSVAGDAVIPAPVNPPAPSVTFDFDERGLVVATPQGAVTPDGILVIAGSPPLNPPTRPGTIAPEVTPLDQLASVIPEGAAPVADAPEDVLLIAGAPSIQPPVRPGTQVTPATSATPAAVQPEALPEQTVGDPASDAASATPGVLPEGLNVIAGAPPVLPPVRPGTQPAAAAPEAVAPDTAEGLNLIAGAPPMLPPVRPGTELTDTPAQSDTPDAAQTDDALPEQTAPSLRPLVRPENITQAAAAAENTPFLGALTQAQAASFRPRTRPAGLAPPPAPEPEAAIEPEPAPAPQQAEAVLQISPEIAAAVAQAAARPDPFASATRLAITASLRPDQRPRNMDRIVARAAQAQQRAATQVAAAAPRAVAPSGPTGGTVAQTATLEGAINLREINLIGIYGGSGDRRALVRLGNGRYQRVTVGDNLDGGRVSAISANALSYTKRGRSITLQVPG